MANSLALSFGSCSVFWFSVDAEASPLRFSAMMYEDRSIVFDLRAATLDKGLRKPLKALFISRKHNERLLP